MPWSHTSSHPSETPAHSAATICAAAAAATAAAPHPRYCRASHCCCVFLADFVFTLDSEEEGVKIYPFRLLFDVALVMKQSHTKLTLIGSAIDKSISFFCAKKEYYSPKRDTYFSL